MRESSAQIAVLTFIKIEVLQKKQKKVKSDLLWISNFMDKHSSKILYTVPVYGRMSVSRL